MLPLDGRAKSLLDALNELSRMDWVGWFEAGFCHYKLTIPIAGGEPFVYKRSILPNRIEGQPFRNAIQFVEEAADRLGRHLIVKPDGEE